MLASTSALLIRARSGRSPKEGIAVEPMPFQVRWRPRPAIVSLGLAQSKGGANTRGAPTGNGHEQENRRNDKREQLDWTRQGGDARYREAGYVLQIAVDHELTVEAYGRAGQTTRAAIERICVGKRRREGGGRPVAPPKRTSASDTRRCQMFEPRAAVIAMI